MLLRPTISGSINSDSHASVVYVLEIRSLFDLIVLDLITAKRDFKNPLDPLTNPSESHSFFFLYRGTRGKFTMRRFSDRMQRLQARLCEPDSDTNIQLIPVSIYWGRTNEKEGSFSRRIVSDHWLASSRFRRALGVVFTRTDILVQLQPAILWSQETNQGQSVDRNLRHIGRLLRATFKQERLAALGPVLASRKAVIQNLAETPDTQDQATTKWRRKTAKRMVANLSYPAMRLLKLVMDVFSRKVYDGIELINVSRIHELAKTHTLIYLPNHRSHVDYLMLSYLLFTQGLAIPHIAAGDNMNLPLIGSLFRRCGAFFIRRTFRDDQAYRELLGDYLVMLLRDGHSIEFFIEGTRSRSGWALVPRMGLLHSVLEIESELGSRPIALVPVYTAYERLIESESYQAELLGAAKRQESFLDVLGSFRILRQRCGTIRVAMGEPIDTNAFSDHENVETVAINAVCAINDVAIVTSTNLVAMAVFSFGISFITTDEVASRLDFLRGLLRVESLHHNFMVESATANDIIEHVSELQLLRSIDGEMSITHATLASFAWYRNNTLHTLASPAVVAVVILNQEEPPTKISLIRQIAGILPHVAAVLKFEMDLHEVRRWFTHFKNSGLIDQDEHMRITTSADDQAAANLRGLANLIMPLLECMYATITCLIERPPQTHTDDSLIDESFELVRRTTTALNIDAMLVFDRRFFVSLVDQLVKSGLVESSQDKKLQSTHNLALIQSRSTAAIDEAFKTELQSHLTAGR